MDHRTRTEDEIKKAEQREAFKQTLLRLLDDPQVQQKIISLIRTRADHNQRDEAVKQGPSI